MCKNRPFYYRMASLIAVSSASVHTYESVSTGGWYWNDVQHFWPATVPFAACPPLFQILAPVPSEIKHHNFIAPFVEIQICSVWYSESMF